MAGADSKAFEQVAMPHLDLLYRVARRLTRHQHEAEDLVQETYLKAYRAFENFELREFGIRPWLLRILHNTHLNRAVRENRAPQAVDHQTLEQSQSGDAAFVPTELDYERLDGEVKRALDQLAPDFRTVLLLWATDELTYQEMAEILDVPIGTVMSRLYRARRQMAERLSEYAQEHRIPPTRDRA